MTTPPPNPKIPNPSLPKATLATYRILAMAALALVFLSNPERAIAMAVVVAVGFAALFLPRFLGAGAFLVTLAVVELIAVFRWPGMRSFRGSFELPEMMMAAGTLLYVGSLYRVHALVVSAATWDPRLVGASSRSRPPHPPQTRPESALTTEEVVAWLISIPIFVLTAELVRRGLYQPTPLDQLVAWRVGHVILAIWSLTIGVLLFWAIFGYWRRSSMSPELARMILEDETWREARRDQGRIGRWLAWRKRTRTSAFPDASSNDDSRGRSPKG
jgi:hypothetical protein